MFVVGSCPSLGPTSFLCRCPFHSTIWILCLTLSTCLILPQLPLGIQKVHCDLGERLYSFWGSNVLLFPLPLPFLSRFTFQQTSNSVVHLFFHNSDGFIMDMSFNNFVFFSPASLSAFLSASCSFINNVAFARQSCLLNQVKQTREFQTRNFDCVHRLARKTFSHGRFVVHSFLQFFHLAVGHRRIQQPTMFP